MRTQGPELVGEAPRARAGTTRTTTPSPAPVDLVRRVWLRSRELATTGEQLDVSDQALLVVRTARHDPDALTRALGLGRSQARHPSSDEATCRGIRILERALAEMGHQAVHHPPGCDP